MDVDDLGGGRLRLAAVNPNRTVAPYRLVRRMRASFCVLGPLLARRGRARVALPGGCNIGHRPVDLHLRGLSALGADIRIERGYVVARARQLCGTRINMTGPCGPSVTGTANVLCAATLARGTTVIDGAAREPEIVDLAAFLTQLGARIEGAGTPTIAIHGVRQLGGARHRVIPDRIEAATLLLAGAITGGTVRVKEVEPAHLGAVLDALWQAGAELDVQPHAISIRATQPLRGVSITAQPYPGFPTDVQPQWMALAAVSNGHALVRDEVFPGRASHIAELVRLGADIQSRCGTVHINGLPRSTRVQKLPATERPLGMKASDLRAAAALVLAALADHRPTIIRGIKHLERGYEELDAKLGDLNATIEGARMPRSAVLLSSQSQES